MANSKRSVSTRQPPLESRNVMRSILRRKNFKIKQFLVAMGTWFSSIWWGGDPDAVSPVSGLTRREVYAVQKSWGPVSVNPVANGTELLTRLFRTYPDTKEHFKMLKNLKVEEYPDSIQFKAHVMNLMTSITLAVNKMNEPEVVIVMMNKIGESHGKRKIPEQNFHELKNVIVNMFIEVLKMDSATLGAWGKTVDFWYKHIFTTLNRSEESR